jgi:hypothetical protein
MDESASTKSKLAARPIGHDFAAGGRRKGYRAFRCGLGRARAGALGKPTHQFLSLTSSRKSDSRKILMAAPRDISSSVFRCFELLG